MLDNTTKAQGGWSLTVSEIDPDYITVRDHPTIDQLTLFQDCIFQETRSQTVGPVPMYFRYSPLELFWQHAMKSLNHWLVRSALEYGLQTSYLSNFLEMVLLV